jgi:hypothetical protein
MIFYVAAGCFWASAVVFVLLASGEEQPWNRPKEERVDSSASSSPTFCSRPASVLFYWPGRRSPDSSEEDSLVGDGTKAYGSIGALIHGSQKKFRV